MKKYTFFLTHGWNFKNENVVSLIEKTKSFEYQEGTLMKFDARKIDWKKYFETYLNGLLNCLNLLEKNRLKKKASETIMKRG